MYRYMHTARTVSSAERVSVRPPRRATDQATNERFQLDYPTWHGRLQGATGTVDGEPTVRSAQAEWAATVTEPATVPVAIEPDRTAA